ncbi:MAG: hypothetical protein JJ908_14475 [Rhizobiales bacterium]|nr:hypothetical protein [Hyphomicrobiales bacterium]MBO6737572.1 hypothetical protein [Hyphomicrobiales bacterium]MBO6913371.1 hypothetical protein [Hyphomicrobiales bacterium]MBO6955833.1 hypothetical protein [Hyphomicrobiales bacterium]
MTARKITKGLSVTALMVVTFASAHAQNLGVCSRTLADAELGAPVCAGNAAYCERFAFNCQIAGGQVLNLSEPYQCRSACYVCQGTPDPVIDLFSGNIAHTWLTCQDDDNEDSPEPSSPAPPEPNIVEEEEIEPQ